MTSSMRVHLFSHIWVIIVIFTLNCNEISDVIIRKMIINGIKKQTGISQFSNYAVTLFIQFEHVQQPEY